jgi:hypothetical protein
MIVIPSLPQKAAGHKRKKAAGAASEKRNYSPIDKAWQSGGTGVHDLLSE